ncbi:MAG TPA: 4-vinyl reductase [Anaerolineales bacterium]
MKPMPINSNFSRAGRILILAMEEILGHNGVISILNLAFPSYFDQDSADNNYLDFRFEHISSLQIALENTYGSRAGRGLFLRVGRACVKYGLREFGPELGITGLAFRLLPLPTRLKVGSEALARLFNNFTDQHISLEIDEKYIHWHTGHCPLCWKRQSGDPCCILAVGFLQEALYWISGGKYYLVEENKCIACGDSTCTIVIDRNPLS